MSANYSERPIEPELLTRLWANLWPRGKEELTRLGYTSEEGYAECLRLGTVAHDGSILCADDEPIVVSGFVAEGGIWATFFQATEAFGVHAKQITRTMREKGRRANNMPVFIYSVLVHPDSERWFRAIGFVRDDWNGMTARGWPLYRFKRK